MAKSFRSIVESDQKRSGSYAVAPVWHTSLVVLFLLGFVALSMHVGRGSDVRRMSHRITTYLVTITAEWLVVSFIGLAAQGQGASIRSLVGENILRWSLILRDLGLAMAFLVVANTLVFLLSHALVRWMNPATSEAIRGLLPQSRLEVAAFLLLSLTAGICEEIIFRGYLQRQCTAWTKSATIGIVMQGTAFGLAHAYQGSTQVILITLYGCMFGLLARWRGSLRPGMLAHFLQDGVGGVLLARFLLK